MSIAIRVNNLSKCYQLYNQPSDRLKQFLWRGRHQYFREFWALRDVSFEVGKGEVLGIIGRNGAGKSTLLQLLCGTLTPTSGNVEVNGRIAALLELGAGFNPEFTGRENVFMSAAILGLSPKEIEQRYEEIVDFSGIRDFIDQPVKTYSSGMYVRLAFSVATSVDPDILIVDEALSVGDGAFSRKSFDRIMALKEAGTTILFCSHSMYQIEVLCQQVLWLEHGQLRMLDKAGKVTSNYHSSLAMDSASTSISINKTSIEIPNEYSVAPVSSARIIATYGHCDETNGTHLLAKSLISTVSITVEFIIDPLLATPTIALGISNAAGTTVSSIFSKENKTAVTVDANGNGNATVIFPCIPLLKGEYHITAFVLCEQGLHIYDSAEQCMSLEISQEGMTQGLVWLPHEWLTNA